MGITYTDRYGKVHVGPTGDDLRAAIRRAQEGPESPAPPTEQQEDGMFVVKENVVVEVRPGVSQLLYRHGTKIPDEEAVRLGLLAVNEPSTEEPSAKKQPAVSNKKRAVSNKKANPAKE